MNPARDDADPRDLRTWSLRHAQAMLVGLPLALWWQAAWPLAAIALVSFGYYVAAQRRVWAQLQPLGGYANWVSVARLGGILGLGFFGPALPAWGVGVIAVALVTADGLDGYLARKYDAASAFGAHLDMETDALQLCLLAALAYFSGALPGLILLVGYTRYAFVLTVESLGVGHRSPRRSHLNRVIAVTIQYCVAAVFVLPAVVHVPAVAIASALLLFSFGRSAYQMLSGDTDTPA